MNIASVFSRTAKAFGFPQEKKAYALSDPAISDLFGVVPTLSGVNVSGQAALYVPAVLQAVRLISETIGSLPCKLYKEAEGGKEAGRAHSAYRIVHRWANDWTGAGELRTTLTADAIIYGNGFARVIRYPDDGRPYALERLEPGTVSILKNTVTGAPVYRVQEAGGTVDHPHTEILHVPSFLGRSPISYGKEAIGLASILERHGAQFFGSGARPSTVLKADALPDNENGANKLKNVRNDYRRWKDDPNAPLILPPGWELEQPVMTSTDAQFLENRVEQINDIARIFGVPPHMLYQLDDGTYSNNEQMQAGFLQLCVRPWLDRWQDAYATVLLTEEERDSHYFEFVIDDLQRADAAARAEIFSKLIAARVMTPNEVRAAMNMPPLPGGDELANPYTSTSQPAGNQPPKETA